LPFTGVNPASSDAAELVVVKIWSLFDVDVSINSPGKLSWSKVSTPTAEELAINPNVCPAALDTLFLVEPLSDVAFVKSGFHTRSYAGHSLTGGLQSRQSLSSHLPPGKQSRQSHSPHPPPGKQSRQSHSPQPTIS
jgi:hypothetical protein